MRTVIIVDDTEDVRAGIHMALTDEGYTVIEAADAQEALPHLRQAPHPCLVVLDQMMPGMSGIDLLEMGASDAKLARHAFALVSALQEKSLPPSIIQLRQSLKVRFLAKPFALEDLFLTLNALEALLVISSS